ncbi:MAG: hypothetical protein JJ966_05635 [Balneolaceae bacterium]|nr:hypothetical protein [Balneolaceae bacterium]
MIFRPSLLFALIVITSAAALAQSGGTNPQNTLLPEINPQDIEIRSEFRARFPGLRRQPILGFNPKPRVFQIDPNRMPFMESREQAVASIAITQLDRPEPPARSVLPTPSRTNVYLKGGFGSFITPEADAYFYQGLGSKSTLTGDFSLLTSDGHLDDQASGFRFMDGDVRFYSKVKKDLAVESSIGFLSDFNRLYNLDPLYQDVIGETTRKDYLGLSWNAALHQTKNALEGLTTELTVSHFEADLDAGDNTTRNNGNLISGNSSEQYVHVEANKYWPGSRLYETLGINAQLTTGRYDAANSASQNIFLGTLGAEYKKLINFNMHATGAFNIAYVSDGLENKFYIAPEAELSYNLKDALLVKGGIKAGPFLTNLQEHYQINRFLNTATTLRHSYQSKAFGEIGLQLFEGNRVYGGLSYQITRNRAYYQRVSEIRIGQDYALFYTINYEKSSTFELFGGITQQLNPEQFWFDAKIYARRPKLDSGADIPYEERFGVTASLNYHLEKSLLLSTWFDVIGKRQSPTNNRELGTIGLVNVKAEYEFSDRFGVYAKVLNILGQKYEVWDGYQERPFQLFGGIIIKL